ncbi:unnamed protein product [Nippostrongylus brasiliensis]|uniref:Secreted protein n=1 Tax=Nippostrongylus brasiliensis TaxID=27835 RepID=A0A0N4YP25_NIPBR|nr:unnamed protein product [Nippostrongylus brasiliensis]
MSKHAFLQLILAVQKNALDYRLVTNAPLLAIIGLSLAVPFPVHEEILQEDHDLWPRHRSGSILVGTKVQLLRMACSIVLGMRGHNGVRKRANALQRLLHQCGQYSVAAHCRKDSAATDCRAQITTLRRQAL